MKKTCTVYFALHPPTTRVISVKERNKYLGCKFWKASKEEADLFYYLYPASVTGHFAKVVGILSCQIFKKNDIMQAWNQIQRLIHFFQLGSQRIKRHWNRLPKYKKILDGITFDREYPKHGLIDDVLTWASHKKVVDDLSINEINKKIKEIRKKIFSENSVDEQLRIDVIALLIEHRCFVLYEDAKELFFPEKEILTKLIQAANEGKVHADYSIDKQVFYFDIHSLVKWLIQNEFLSQSIISKFPFLKIEAIKENLVKFRDRFNSLSKLLSKGQDRAEILAEAMNHNLKVYLKYPRKYLRWREGWQAMLDAAKTSYFADLRYDGFGQLKVANTDDTFRCQFGGLTIDMLFHGEKPEYCTSKPVYEIEFVPTKIEYEAGLQPYAAIPQNEVDEILSNENLILVAPDKSEEKIKQKSDEIEPKVEIQKLVESDQHKIWENLFAMLHQISGSMQKGNKMELVDSAISHILNAVKVIHPTFDPMNMPGSVEDFHKFCLAMPSGGNIFPDKKRSFGKYCRRTMSGKSNKDMPPLCGWINPTKPNKQFWSELKPNSKTFTFNYRTFD